MSLASGSTVRNQAGSAHLHGPVVGSRVQPTRVRVNAVAAGPVFSTPGKSDRIEQLARPRCRAGVPRLRRSRR